MNINFNINAKFFDKLKNEYGEINFENYLSEDYVDMDYDTALKFDKRTFCEFLFENIKDNQMIIDTFCNKDHFKPITIKLFLFLLRI